MGGWPADPQLGVGGGVRRSRHGAGPHPPEPSTLTPGRAGERSLLFCFLLIPLLEGPQVPGTD